MWKIWFFNCKNIKNCKNGKLTFHYYLPMQPTARNFHSWRAVSELANVSSNSVCHVSVTNWRETLELLYDLSSLWLRANSICHVASPSSIRLLNSRARLVLGSQSFLWMVLRFVAAMCSRIFPNFPTSFSATVTDISGQFTAEGNGKRMPSAIITGTHPNATDSTSLGLHGAHPKGHRQNTDRAISDW